MSFLSTRFVHAVRNVSPCLLKRFSPCNGFQRFYWSRRGDAFSELSTAMQSIENSMREMDRMFQRASPFKWARIIPPFNVGRIREIPVVSTGDGRSYKLELDMQGMEPENISITLKNNELTVTARRDEKREDGSRFVRENTYHYTLPNDITPDTVRSSLSDGVLIIEAPLPALESKEIPVNIVSGQKSNSDSEKK